MFSSEEKFDKGIVPPPRPTWLTMVVEHSGCVRLSWQASFQSADEKETTSYDVEYRDLDSNRDGVWKAIQRSIDLNSTSLQACGLPRSMYRFAVIAKSADGLRSKRSLSLPIAVIQPHGEGETGHSVPFIALMFACNSELNYSSPNPITRKAQVQSLHKTSHYQYGPALTKHRN